MGNPFKQTYREAGTKKGKFYTILIFGLFIFLFLYLFEPFGLATLEPLEQLFITMGFGVITSFVLVVFKFLIEPVVVDEKWTLGKSILWDIIIASSIGSTNYIYVSIIFQLDFSIKYLLYSIWTAILVGSIPVTITYIMVYNKLYKSALIKAAVPEEQILWEDEVTIRAGNSRNEFRVNPRNIIYFSSNDNYVTIVTMKGESQNKTTIRGTLKAVESELKRNNRFIRCHKCYIVNADFVERVSGNSQHMKIKLNPAGIEIPVSRSRAPVIARKLKVI